MYQLVITAATCLNPSKVQLSTHGTKKPEEGKDRKMKRKRMGQTRRKDKRATEQVRDNRESEK